MSARRLIAVVATAAALLISQPTPEAEARTMPCTGDRLVQVVDGPNWRRADGLTVNIGYLFPGCFGEGKWIGHIGDGSRYVPLDEADLRFLMQRAGLTALPPVPSRTDYIFSAFLGEVIGLAIVVVLLGWNTIRPARQTATA